jgi:uncharacterized protein (TIGR01777 family)
MRILVSGSTGLVGSFLVPSLAARNHQVVRLVRRPAVPGAGQAGWDPDTGKLYAGSLEGFDAVVHLAGENIAAGRWTGRRKARIVGSRAVATRNLSRALSALDRPPRILVSASAVGFYGDRGEEILEENSSSGSGFLAETCRLWEQAAAEIDGRRTRLVVLRIGMVLSREGGALAKMLPAFRLGLGGRLGSGKQYMSWVALEDLAEIVHHVILDPSIHGAVNAAAPNPVTNREFTRALGAALNRPAAFVVPAFAVRALFGEMGREVLLSSTRAVPARLMEAGFTFALPELGPALAHVLRGS